jgi:hypothetical protein
VTASIGRAASQVSSGIACSPVPNQTSMAVGTAASGPASRPVQSVSGRPDDAGQAGQAGHPVVQRRGPWGAFRQRFTRAQNSSSMRRARQKSPDHRCRNGLDHIVLVLPGLLSGRTDCSSNRRTREIRNANGFHRQDRGESRSASVEQRIWRQAREDLLGDDTEISPLTKTHQIRRRHPRGDFGRRGSANQHRLSNTTPHRRQSPSRAQQACRRQRRSPQQRRSTQRRTEFRQTQGADQGISRPSIYAHHDPGPAIDRRTHQSRSLTLGP